jgi:ABC-2 type transport system ATP-binding protein
VSDAVIEVAGLSKRFGEQEALREVSFAARQGELLAVIGPNGAGKTTLLSILAGILRPDSGSVSRPPGEIGWVPQQVGLYRRLTVAENLRLFARLERSADPEAAVELMLEQTGLGDRRDDQVANLSGGNQQRVNIAIGLLARPEVLLLDEPSSGLDEAETDLFGDLLEELAAEGMAILLVEHDVELVMRVCHDIYVLDFGRLIAHGAAKQVQANDAVQAAYLGAESEALTAAADGARA